MAEPRIVAFLCNWCAYSAADQAGRSRAGYPQSLLAVRVMCSGRVEPAFVLQAFREGADGVLVCGCHPGDCHYVDGNLKAAARHALLSAALEQLGIERERFRIEWVSASDGDRFAAIAADMTERLRALGPLRYHRSSLEAVEDAIALAVHRVDEIEARPRAAPPAPRPGEKPKLAFYWNASCGGCEEAVVDLAEGVLPVLEQVEIVLWPVALDAKRADVEALADGAIAAAFLNGAVRLAEQEEWSRLLRRKSRLVVAFGACAHTGGIVGLGNLADRQELLDTAYRSAPSVANPGQTLPGRPTAACGHEVTLPPLLSRALPLCEVVEVDYTLPGCPPSPQVIGPALGAILSGNLPPRGTVLSPGRSLCEVCPRRESKPEKLEIAELRGLDRGQPDPRACFLAEGYLCMGPATRQGCEPGCIGVNVPCRGCFGAVDGVRDQGAAMLSALGSLLSGAGEERLRAAAASLADPAGAFWRYGLGASLLPRRARGGGL